MKKLFTGTLLAFSIFTIALVGSGCQSNTEEAETPSAASSTEQSASSTEPTAPQANPNAAPQMSPEAAKAAEDAMRRDKAGY